MAKSKFRFSPDAAALPLLQRIGLFLLQINHLRRVLKGMYFGRPATCSICSYRGRFLPFGLPPRYNALCPHCGSVERHRLFALYLQRTSQLNTASRIIHFAPEPALERIFRTTFLNYRTADAYRKAVDLTLDLEHIALPDQSADLVLCFHVLEHVDDTKALPELFRVLSSEGTLFLMVPIVEGWEESYEAVGITSAQDREDHFGQFDHVRYYGSDLRRRVTDAGFSLTEFTASGDDSVRYGLVRGEKVFICEKF